MHGFNWISFLMGGSSSCFPLTKSVSISALYRFLFFLHRDSWCPCGIILRGGPGSSIYVYYKFRDCAPIKTYRQSTNRSNIWLEKATEGYRNSRVA